MNHHSYYLVFEKQIFQMSDGRVIETKADADEVFWNKPYFAFLDILGFRELVKNNSHEYLVEIYKSVVKFPVDFYTNLHESEQTAKKEKYGEGFNPTGLRLVSISDSIMIWTDNCKESTLFELIVAVKTLMIASFSLGIPLRGSIVMGDVEIIESDGSLSIVGKGLVHAYESEARQNWAGCTIDKGIFRYLKSFQEVVMKNDAPLRIESADYLFRETDIPMKGESRKGYAINWAKNIDLSEEDIRKAFEAHSKRIKETPEIKAKIDEKVENTLKFFREFQTS
jgi:hypothetical protein